MTQRLLDSRLAEKSVDGNKRLKGWTGRDVGRVTGQLNAVLWLRYLFLRACPRCTHTLVLLVYPQCRKGSVG